VGNADINEVKAFEKFDTETGEFESFKIFGGSVFKKIGESEGFNSFCAVAAHVTAYARMTLLNFIMLSGWENCFYMDTDSLIVNKKGHENLLPFHDQKILGKIKEEKRDTKLIINCPKDYSFAGETKRKGNKKDSIQVDDMTFESTMWPKINSCIRSGSLNGYKNIDRKKVLTRAYNKGWVDKDGNVYPFTLKIHGKRENAILPPTVDTKDFYDMVRGKPQIKNQKDIILKKFRKYLMGNW
jgi:hypothetical protein